MGWRIPVARPDLGAAEQAAVAAVMASGWITQGPKVRELEERFARLCGVPHAVATNTGTAALHVALLALDVGAGDEVITTPLSCIASANPILFQGARPVFADVDAETYNLAPAAVERCVTARTRAILPVHLFGHPADMDALRAVARRHGLPIVEDASQATGAEYRGRRVGGLGDVGCFSLYANKIVTSAEGGMVVTADDGLAAKMAAMRNFGQRPGEHFVHAFLGGNYKMSDLHAAIGCVQLDKIDGYIARRRDNVAALNAALAPLGGLFERLPTERPWARAVHFGYHMLFRSVRLRGAAEEAFHAAGVETRPFFSLIPAEEPYRGLGFVPGDTPVAADLAARGLYVSNSPDLTPGDRALIVDTLGSLARAHGVA
ncbi:MAG TPA: DegT/DnrJ/EryC1/StrS family aminotransferase [Pseudomonadales bacterium]|nr:DegT/DnrJ/EryC1/StrS family aminotransferase [Pseudomonadales bacterium]